MNNAFDMQFFSCDQRKTFRQIEPHLVTKGADGARAGAVAFLHAGIQNMLQQGEVLLHGCKLKCLPQPAEIKILV